MDYELKISLFEDQEFIIQGNELSTRINYLKDRFESHNRLFVKGNNIYVDMISVNGWRDHRNENQGYFRDLVKGIIDNDYNVIVITPMGFVMNSILKRYGFRRFFTDTNNYYGVPVEIMYLTQEMKNLPRIFSGCIGRDKEEEDSNKYAFGFYTERGELLGHTLSEIGDNMDIAYNTIHKILDKVINTKDTTHPEELKKRFQDIFPNGYRLSFLIDSEQNYYFQDWFYANVPKEYQ